jgi:hypothetical protein
MTNTDFPKCPICEKQVLVPLSAVVEFGAVKTFAHWICLGCGFYFGTGDTKASNILDDIIIRIYREIPKSVHNAKRAHVNSAKLP